MTFTTAGTHTITARYDGGFGFFDQVTSTPLALAVQGQALSFNVIGGGSLYGQVPVVVANLFTTEDSPIAPTGTIIGEAQRRHRSVKRRSVRPRRFPG